jgi:MFS transporter, PAT family, beta-lactamase induction signal transducer AmpG
VGSSFCNYIFYCCFLHTYRFYHIAVFAAAMNLCWKRISATQFTLYMTISNLGLAAGARLLGPLTSHMSWELVLATAAVFPLVMLVLTSFIHFESHTKRVDLLDVKYAIPINESL